MNIALIGAGSVVFARNVIADILWHESLRESDFRLVDIDPERLETAELLARSVNHSLNAGATIMATADRRRALDGADVVITTYNVGGMEATRNDLMIPAEFGLHQTVSDTLGPGGIFRSARSIPVLTDICAEMAALCPDAMLVNYVNPMAMHCLAVARASGIRCVGLCHGVQNTAGTMRMYLEMARRGVKAATVDRHLNRPWGDETRNAEWQEWDSWGADPQLTYTCAGINHMAFFLRFGSGDQDLYPEFRKLLKQPHLRRLDAVRFEVFERLGYFMAETSRHTAEYVPWFLHHPTEVERLEIQPSSYLRTCQEQDVRYHQLRQSLLDTQPVIDSPYTSSNEHVSRMLNAMVTDQPYRFNGNVINTDSALISNLPADSCVEVPCIADRGGITPMRVGDLPPQCAALIRTNLNVQDLAVHGILEGNHEHLRHALMLDPNTASTLTLPRIDELLERMLSAHRDHLPPSLQTTNMSATQGVQP